MMRHTARSTAVQVSEFVVGVAASYVAVGAAWAATGGLVAPILVALMLIGMAALAEVRYGARATGLVAGVLPTAVLTAGALAALVPVLDRLGT